MWIGHRKDIHSDEELTRKTSALESLSDEQFTLWTQSTKPNYLAMPPINEARNSPPLHLFVVNGYVRSIKEIHAFLMWGMSSNKLYKGLFKRTSGAYERPPFSFSINENDNLQGKKQTPMSQNTTRTLGLESSALPSSSQGKYLSESVLIS